MLYADPGIPAGHIWERLIDEYDATVSYSTLRGYVARQRHITEHCSEHDSDQIHWHKTYPERAGNRPTRPAPCQTRVSGQVKAHPPGQLRRQRTISTSRQADYAKQTAKATFGLGIRELGAPSRTFRISKGRRTAQSRGPFATYPQASPGVQMTLEAPP